ncbi:MAG: flagellar basal body P-ring formation chaperone FlgA, partial [candidate division Zixibacteria bacterium]
QTRPIGRFAIILKVTRPEAKVEKETIRLYISKFGDVVVAGERIKKFDNISRALVSIERREITTFRQDPLVSLKSVTNMRARRNIAKNRVLTKADIELKPVVKSYSDVHIIYVSGLCRITAEGKALQDGQTGELIRVKNKSSGKIVFARIVDKNLVQVDP